MSTKRTRAFNYNGEKCYFNNLSFASFIKNLAKEKNLRRGQIVEDLAGLLSRTPDAIRNWQYSKNGPADIEIIKEIASYFQVDTSILLKRYDGGHPMDQLSDRQKNAVKRIYDILIWFLEEFRNTDGFNDWWLEFKDAGYKQPENQTYERINTLERKVILVFKQEYFDLHDLDIYDELFEFIDIDLTATYEGKVSYAYRFEADGVNEHTISQDYEKAMQRLNQIIEKDC